jgi:putative tryptophan/tyrosine transport system substrate-binding protein
VAVLWNPANPMLPQQLRETEVAARTLRVRLQPVEARGPDEFDGAFSAIIRERAGALLVTTDPMFFTHRRRLAELAARNHLPAMYGLRDHVEAGGLMGYGASVPDLFRRAATYVDKILKGAKPADLPMEQPTRFELVVNMKTQGPRPHDPSVGAGAGGRGHRVGGRPARKGCESASWAFPPVRPASAS